MNEILGVMGLEFLSSGCGAIGTILETWCAVISSGFHVIGLIEIGLFVLELGGLPTLAWAGVVCEMELVVPCKSLVTGLDELLGLGVSTGLSLKTGLVMDPGLAPVGELLAAVLASVPAPLPAPD